MKHTRRFLFSLAALLLLYSCKVTHKEVTSYHTAFTVIDTTLPPDGRYEAFLKPYRQKMDTMMNVVIGHSETPLSKAQPECTMGNFMADAQLAQALLSDPATQVSIINYGGMRLPYVSPGAITRGKVYEMMPFDNKLAIVEIPGKVMQQFCDHMAEYGGWPVAGITFVIKDKKAVQIQIKGKPLNLQLVYPTAVSDYIANGGDNCDFLLNCKKTFVNIFVRDMLMQYLEALDKQGKPLRVPLEKRISYAE